MEIVEFPKALRVTLADLDLQRETGKLSLGQYNAQRQSAIQSAMADAKDDHGNPLTAAWSYGPTAPADNRPDGFTAVWWR